MTKETKIEVNETSPIKNLEETNIEFQEILSTEKPEEANIEEKTEEAKTPFSILDMLKAGVHFGHKTLRWNAKMAPYIYGEKNKLHIIDLTQTNILLEQATKIVFEIAKARGKILFVATKQQASKTLAEEATRCGQPYVNQKWLGGMLTNWKTIKNSLKTLNDLENQLNNKDILLTKKEKLMLIRKKEKLERNLGGIRDMGKYPDLLFVIDTNRETIAISEAKNLGIPVMAIVDTNSNPDLIDYPIPGNDDSIKAIRLYCKVLADAIIEGSKQSPENKEVQIKKVKKLDDRKKDKIKKFQKEQTKEAVAEFKEKTPAEIKETMPAEVKEKIPAKIAEAKTPIKVKEEVPTKIEEETTIKVKKSVKKVVIKPNKTKTVSKTTTTKKSATATKAKK
jgi:small subunit ribosomal protein S2